MHFLVDKSKKIIFGWSAKCACTLVKKIFFYFRDNKIISFPHHPNVIDRHELPKDLNNYDVVIFSRCPYKKILSGFLDKYKKNGEFRHIWKDSLLTFNNFVNELIKNDWKMVEKHHFTPQTSEKFTLNLLKSKSIKFFDIENIDYSYIENLYKKKIPSEILTQKMGHERVNFIKKDKVITEFVYDKHMDEISDCNIDIKYFYNQDIINKVYNFYKEDFNFFKNNGIDYTNSSFLNV